MKSGKGYFFCSEEDVFCVAGIDDEQIRNQESDRIRKLIESEPVFLWGDDFRKRIRGREMQASCRVAHSVALKSGLITNKLLAEAIKSALESSEFFIGTYRERVESWLTQHWAKLTAVGAVVGYFLCKKGEFGHFDEVKTYLYTIRKRGGDVRILKGDDYRATRIANELYAERVPVRLVQHELPKTRFYLCEDKYLFFFSFPRRIFWGFTGSDPATLLALRNVFEGEWSEAKIPEIITQPTNPPYEE